MNLRTILRRLPTVDWLLTLNLILWGLICLALLGGAIIYIP